MALHASGRPCRQGSFCGEHYHALFTLHFILFKHIPLFNRMGDLFYFLMVLIKKINLFYSFYSV